MFIYCILFKGEEDRIGCGWTTSGTTCWRENCQSEEAQDRVKWRRLIRNIDPQIKVGKDAEEEDIISIISILAPHHLLGYKGSSSPLTHIEDGMIAQA